MLAGRRPARQTRLARQFQQGAADEPFQPGRDRRLRHGQVPPRLLAGPKEPDEHKQAFHPLHVHPIAPGPRPIVCDKGFAGAGIEKASADLGHPLIRPARDDEPAPALPFPGRLRQRIEAIIRTLKNQLGLERHNARTTEGLGARVSRRILALKPAIWHNGNTGAPVKRSLTAYDH